MNLDRLLEAARLKAVARAGWVRRGVPEPESVAAHSWGIAWLALALAPPGLDRARLLAYAVLHDLPEVRVGDLTPADAVPPAEKAAREHAAMADLCAGRPDLLALYEAYEAAADPEARYVRELDKLDMAIQALVYAESGASGMEEFVASAAARVADPELRAVLDAVRDRLTPRAG